MNVVCSHRLQVYALYVDLTWSLAVTKRQSIQRFVGLFGDCHRNRPRIFRWIRAFGMVFQAATFSAPQIDLSNEHFFLCFAEARTCISNENVWTKTTRRNMALKIGQLFCSYFRSLWVYGQSALLALSVWDSTQRNQ